MNAGTGKSKRRFHVYAPDEAAFELACRLLGDYRGEAIHHRDGSEAFWQRLSSEANGVVAVLVIVDVERSALILGQPTITADGLQSGYLGELVAAGEVGK